ncbi:MAG TPA: hypothetical protein VIR27_02850 [Mycobacteriales bacterium]
MRGRQSERSALAGWPDDHEADLYRDEGRGHHPGGDGDGDQGRRVRRERPVNPAEPGEPGRPVGTRDPQRDVWDG